MRSAPSFAVAPVVVGELELDQAGGFDLFRGHEVVHVQLVRGFEKHSVAVPGFAFGG